MGNNEYRGKDEMNYLYLLPRIMGIYDGIGPKAKLLGLVVYQLYHEPINWERMRLRGMYSFYLGKWEKRSK